MTRSCSSASAHCAADSPQSILDLRGYYGFVTYTAFVGVRPREDAPRDETAGGHFTAQRESEWSSTRDAS
mgnify:CR=1 FL=1